MTRKRKTVTMIVEVNVPVSMPAADARREVRACIIGALGLGGNHLKIAVKKVAPAGPILEAARMADQAWGVAKAVRAKPPKPGPVTPLLEAMGEK